METMEQIAEVEPVTSPVPEEVEGQKTLTFPEAIAEATIGKRIQRLEWHDSEYGYFRNDFLMIHKKDEDFYWQVSLGDAINSDWISF